MQTVNLGSWLGLLLLGVAASTATATEPVVRSVPPAAVSAAAGTVPAPTHYVDGLGPSVDIDTLAKSSGGTEVIQQMTLDGTVSDNHADHVLTGDNVISTGSFVAAAGMPMVIQNTGNNVLIQNATIVNVQFQP